MCLYILLYLLQLFFSFIDLPHCELMGHMTTSGSGNLTKNKPLLFLEPAVEIKTVLTADMLAAIHNIT